MPISEWNPDVVLSDAERKTNKLLRYMAIKVQTDAKLLCPVDTGNLRRSISYFVYTIKLSAIVGTNVEYALFVEEGTKYWKGKPFLHPALKKLSQRDVNKILTMV